MIDYIKLPYTSKEYYDFLKNHKDLNFTREYKNTQAISSGLVASYKGLDFNLETHFGKPLPISFITGSVHKFKNDGFHNSDNFTVSDVCGSLLKLCKQFQIPAHQVKVQSPEFGLNIDLGFKPDDNNFFNKIIVLNSDKGSVKPTNYDPKDPKSFDIGRYFALSDHYGLKIYHKENTILRVEIKILKTQKLKKLKALKRFQMETLLDYCNPDFLIAVCKELVIPTFNKILFNEDVCESDMAPETFKKFQYLSNTANWNYIQGEEKRKAIIDIKRIFELHGINNFSNGINNLLVKKLDECSILDENGKNYYKQLQEGKYLNTSRGKMLEIPTGYHSIESNLLGLINHSINRETPITNKIFYYNNILLIEELKCLLNKLKMKVKTLINYISKIFINESNFMVDN